MKELLVALILLGQLVLLIFADYDKWEWVSIYWIWHKSVMLLSMILIRKNIKSVHYSDVFLLLSWFFALLLAWEIVIAIYPLAQTGTSWVQIIFLILVLAILCIMYLPLLKTIWQRLK